MSLHFEKLAIGEPKHEFVHGVLYRSKVPGGWLVYLFYSAMGSHSTSSLFYPDPEHVWDGSSISDPELEMMQQRSA